MTPLQHSLKLINSRITIIHNVSTSGLILAQSIIKATIDINNIKVHFNDETVKYLREKSILIYSNHSMTDIAKPFVRFVVGIDGVIRYKHCNHQNRLKMVSFNEFKSILDLLTDKF